MRLLAYAAGAYAVVSTGVLAAAPSGGAAFVAKPGTGELGVRHRQGTATRAMGKQKPSVRMATNDDPSEVLSRVDSMMNSNSMHTVAANLESSFTSHPLSAQQNEDESEAAQSSSTGYSPPAGYVPERFKPAEDDHETAVMNRVISMMNSEEARKESGGQQPRQAKKWQLQDACTRIQANRRPAENTS